MVFPGGSAVNNLPANTGDSRDMDSIYGLGRPPERKWQPAPVFSIEKSSAKGHVQQHQTVFCMVCLVRMLFYTFKVFANQSKKNEMNNIDKCVTKVICGL